MMSNEKVKVVSFYLTLKCDKYCRMCCVNSKKNGPSMPFAMLQTAVDKLADWLAPDPVIGLSGGEPFLYEDSGMLLPDVVKLLRDRDYQVDIQTSCWDRGDRLYEERFKMLEPLLESGKIWINTSFSLYQKPGAEDRLKSTLQVLWGSGLTPGVYMVLDLDNAIESFTKFYQIAGSLELEPEVSLDSVIQGIKDQNPYKVFKLISFAGPAGGLRLAASAVQKVGRGRSLKVPTVRNIGCTFITGSDSSLAIYPSGSVIHCRVPQSIDVAPIGNILEHSAEEILASREARREALSAFLAELPADQSICQKCVQYQPAPQLVTCS
jgi:MoaA/NifB/PqqE/SkfB family radical SAM enzyme